MSGWLPSVPGANTLLYLLHYIKFFFLVASNIAFWVCASTLLAQFNTCMLVISSYFYHIFHYFSHHVVISLSFSLYLYSFALHHRWPIHSSKLSLSLTYLQYCNDNIVTLHWGLNFSFNAQKALSFSSISIASCHLRFLQVWDFYILHSSLLWAPSYCLVCSYS